MIEELGDAAARLVWELLMWGRALSPVQRGEAPQLTMRRHSLFLRRRRPKRKLEDSGAPPSRQKPAAPAKPYNSIENIAEFFASRGKKFTVPKTPVEEPTGKRGFRPGQKVRHPKYGEGTVYQREGEGEEAKITVQFPRFGLKKLVEKYAQLERA